MAARPPARRHGRAAHYASQAAMAAAGAWMVYCVARALGSVRYAVEGDSMRPTLRPGDYLLVSRLARVGRSPAPGDVVVLRDPQRQGMTLVKRVEAAEAGRYFVRGDNDAASRDSRAFGPVRREGIVGRAWLRYWPLPRVGFVRRGR